MARAKGKARGKGMGNPWGIPMTLRRLAGINRRSEGHQKVKVRKDDHEEGRSPREGLWGCPR